MPKNFEPRPALAHRREQELEEEALDLAAMEEQEAEEETRTKKATRGKVRSPKTERTSQKKAEEPTELLVKIQGVTPEELDHAFDGFQPEDFTAAERQEAAGALAEMKMAFSRAKAFMFPSEAEIDAGVEEFDKARAALRQHEDLRPVFETIEKFLPPVRKFVRERSTKVVTEKEGKGAYRTREATRTELTTLGKVDLAAKKQAMALKRLIVRPWFLALIITAEAIGVAAGAHASYTAESSWIKQVLE